MGWFSIERCAMFDGLTPTNRRNFDTGFYMLLGRGNLMFQVHLKGGQIVIACKCRSQLFPNKIGHVQ